ncbi:hypothetical protein StoSoilB3_11030 [Arthrobacter sp. StoSoilB3]|nr:hypothetical protein NtRootA2_10810 [Arthrobacter sp. NtRootA2]BCW13881.1 hypothetical protein NtRootA4_08600 [Arthrobacter sp. NtRootA4]BCW22216.1 hypothetical protein NtRootC7_10830 [Arthrobacter sp. NtRootC7]BCW26484.1 hypothetical protein NtRootC45_10840 [Arthrobacter sp. NtRootC45]BCW30753.1 hypothetical protein NtRootD5_10840 [Arthrobacter sp. NtRootD5]BCW39568.1 hypothetical protein StoSoilB3_11030 [Arthrobacter sp. StoSoilB3]
MQWASSVASDGEKYEQGELRPRIKFQLGTKGPTSLWLKIADRRVGDTSDDSTWHEPCKGICP